MEFVRAGTISESDPGGEAELEVWSRLRQAFDSNDRGVVYHQYPIIQKQEGNRFDRKPDFVVLHEDLGLIIVECKGYTIDQINRIEGERWILRNCRQQSTTPQEQARDQGYHLKSFFHRESALRNDQGQVKVPMNTFVVVPNIDRDEWDARGFDGPAAPRLITGDELGPVTLRDRLSSVKTFDPLDNEAYEAARGVLSCGSVISDGTEPVEDESTKGEYHRRVTAGIKKLDRKQEEIGFQIPDGPQQIRGIAGSGKTVLTAMKTARILAEHGPHANGDHEPWRVALTFSSKSLYDHLTALVESFYERFTGDPFDAVSDSIEIFHAWGGETTGPGLYKTIVDATPGVEFRNLRDAKRLDEENPQEVVAKEVFETGAIPSLYDAIIVDEAQDFGPAFLNMCLEALDDTNRLIWAYDEAQDLGSLSAPQPKNVFGTDEDGELRVDMSGSYSDGVQKSHVMRTAYRTPRSVLMAAHGIGMGLERHEGPIQTVTRQEGWRSLGYEVEGDFRQTGTPVRVTRPRENSPHPLADESGAKPFLRRKWFDGRRSEIHWVADQIAEDIDAGMRPRNVLVVGLGYRVRNHKGTLSQALADHGVEVTFDWEESNKQFALEGAVTASSIRRAKGNEAGSVYVVGLDTVDSNGSMSPIQRRNAAFVALTRTTAWCTVTGVQESAVLDEFDRVFDSVNQSQPELRFEVPESLERELEEDTVGRNKRLDSF
jgi:superfamily I DNA and RNA helicase